MSLKTKLWIFETNVKSVLLYGSETWKQTKKNEHDLQVFIKKCLRRILNIRWPDRITNIELLRKTNQTPIVHAIKQRKWRRIGHILRRPKSNITKQALDWNPHGKMEKRTTCDDMEKDTECGVEVNPDVSGGEAKRTAHDRDRWKTIVEALCSPRSE